MENHQEILEYCTEQVRLVLKIPKELSALTGNPPAYQPPVLRSYPRPKDRVDPVLVNYT